MRISDWSSDVCSSDLGNVDPSITLQYDIAPRVMVYATYGRGSKSGGFVSNTLGTVDSTFTFEPERSTNYEAGIKSTLAGGAVVRSEERRVGKEGVRTVRSRWSPYH